MTVVHVVTFTFIDDTPPDRIVAFGRALDALSSVCCGTESFWHGLDLGIRPGSSDYAIAAVFTDAAALDRYLTHPSHIQLNADFGPIIAGKSSVQFFSDPKRSSRRESAMQTDAD